MFQNEVANRLVALPRTKSYGRLSVMSQWRSNVKILFKVPATAFTPVPKIDSSVVQITPAKRPYFSANQAHLQALVKLAFGQRRKMLRQSLRSLDPDIKSILTNLGIDPQSRPEELSIEKFCQLATHLEENQR